MMSSELRREQNCNLNLKLTLIILSMRSKASIKSHPLHPILVVFPIAFFIGTSIFDVLGLNL